MQLIQNNWFTNRVGIFPSKTCLIRPKWDKLVSICFSQFSRPKFEKTVQNWEKPMGIYISSRKVLENMMCDIAMEQDRLKGIILLPMASFTDMV